jgi:acetyl esterase/lipase
VELPVRHQLLVYPVTFPPGGSTESRRVKRHTAMFIGAGAFDFFSASYLSQHQPAGQYQPAGDVGHQLDYLDGLLWVRTDPRVSPFAAANGHAGLAPATVILAEVDPLVDEGRQYAAALTTAAVPTHVLEYRMPHGFFILGHALALPEAAAAVREAAHAVNQGLRRADP